MTDAAEDMMTASVAVDKSALLYYERQMGQMVLKLGNNTNTNVTNSNCHQYKRYDLWHNGVTVSLQTWSLIGLILVPVTTVMGPNW